jgi:hypothetical protein
LGHFERASKLSAPSAEQLRPVFTPLSPACQNTHRIAAKLCRDIIAMPSFKSQCPACRVIVVAAALGATALVLAWAWWTGGTFTLGPPDDQKVGAPVSAPAVPAPVPKPLIPPNVKEPPTPSKLAPEATFNPRDFDDTRRWLERQVAELAAAKLLANEKSNPILFNEKRKVVEQTVSSAATGKVAWKVRVQNLTEKGVIFQETPGVVQDPETFIVIAPNFVPVADRAWLRNKKRGDLVMLSAVVRGIKINDRGLPDSASCQIDLSDLAVSD